MMKMIKFEMFNKQMHLGEGMSALGKKPTLLIKDNVSWLNTVMWKIVLI